MQSSLLMDSQVCGRLRGYQVGHPKLNAFGPYVNDKENAYLVIDGILISHGKTQKHVWAYATGFQKVLPSSDVSSNVICPCTDPRYDGIIPPFIGNNYYCDSGVNSGPVGGIFYTTPLWTGNGCSPPNFCCFHSRMPWFCKTLPIPTTNYIEVRNCHNGPTIYEDTALELIELYVR